MKVALIGPYPPPFGGISVAIQRLKILLEELGVVCCIYDTSTACQRLPGVTPIRGQKHWFLRHWLTAREDIIHYQDSSWRGRTWIGLLPWRAKTVVSVQGYSLVDSWTQGGILRRTLIQAALRRTSFLILSNPDYVQFARSQGVVEDRMAVIPAFIPPIPNDEDDSAIPPEVWLFCRSHTPLLLANGTIAFYRGEDLYGVDLLIELVRALKPGYPQLGLIFLMRPFVGQSEQAYWQALQARVEAYGLTENLQWIMEGVAAMHPLVRACDLFLRPTNTDGDAVSIREALHFRVPVVASDASPRPIGTVLFRSRDVEDLVTQARRVLAGELLPEPAASVSSFDQIWQIYQRLARCSR